MGPLGDTTGESNSPLSPDDKAPEPPQKESFAARNVRPTSPTSRASSLAGMMDSVNLEEDGASIKGPPPVQPPVETDAGKRPSQPSVSIEQAAKPTFEIVVGDPHKVGDLTSSHIVYQVRTKVRGSERMTVGHGVADRRYRQAPRHTGYRNLPSVVDIAISSGFIIRSIIAIPVLLWPLPRRSKQLAGSIPTLWNPDELRWSVCSIRLPHTLSCNTMETLKYSWRVKRLVSTSRTRRTGNRTWASTRACSVHSGSMLVVTQSLWSMTT